jgi:hypothetical protein
VFEQVFDVAGVPVLVRAPDEALARPVVGNLAGFPAIDVAPVASIAVVRERAARPDRPADDQWRQIRFWLEDDGVVATYRDLLVRAAGTSAVAHVPDEQDREVLEDLAALGVTWLLAPHGRFILHGGALARDDRAVLVIGNTGAGKSTLAAAALEAGWPVLADDQVVLDASATPFFVHGLHQEPAVPREIGGPVAASGMVLGDLRDRARLPRSVLAAGGVPVVGVVLVNHSDVADGALEAAPTSTVFPQVLQSFPGTAASHLRAAFFPIAGALARLPGFTLGHARTPSLRRARAIDHLEQVFEALSARS